VVTTTDTCCTPPGLPRLITSADKQAVAWGTTAKHANAVYLQHEAPWAWGPVTAAIMSKPYMRMLAFAYQTSHPHATCGMLMSLVAGYCRQAYASVTHSPG